jgi:hypothetical protein
MDNMKTNSELLREIIASAKPELQKISAEKASAKSNPKKWSKKEILGHLIDSASNNHQRFVRGAQNLAADFPAYNQNNWVDVNRYNERDWFELVEFFCSYNIFLSHIIDSLTEEAMNNMCNFGSHGLVKIEFVITDYIRHLQHHIQQILEK